MELSKLDVVSCDVLVIGGGGAGLRAAIEAGEMGADVLVVSKYRVGYGNNTIISKATFAAPSGWAEPRDNPGVHVKDTVIGGRFINDQKLVAAVAEESGAQVAFLEKCGVRFLKRAGDIRALHPPGHSYPRHVRADPEIGRSITLPLRKYAGEKGVRFADRVFITRLFSSKDGRISAAMGITHDGRTLAFQGNCFVLATGGFGQMYLRTNNAPGITGDGQALAFESGLPLRDMEFVQFFPTAAGKMGTRTVVYEDLIVGNNAVLRNSYGDDIIAKHGMASSFAVTRDRLTRAVLQEILEGRGVEGGVIMDLRGASEELLVEYESLFRDPDKKEFIVSPTTHFCNGGIIVNENAETDLPGLFAAGEVCAGVHGANRLAGNALSEVFAMGGIAGRKAASKAREIDRPELPEKAITAEKKRLESLLSNGSRPLRELSRSIKEVMWYKAGIIRNGRELEEAIGQIEEFNSRIPELQLKDFRELIKSLELQNVLNLAEMVCRAALLRTESRGAHYRSDFPEENNKDWLKNIVITKKDSGMKLQAVPVSMDIIKQ